MIKKLAASVLTVFLFSVCTGQVSSADNVKFGFKDGFGISGHWSNQKNSQDDSVESRFTTGYLFGVTVRFTLSDALKLQPELLYFRKGSKQDVTIPGSPLGTLFVKYRLPYLELPVTLKWYFLRKKGSFRPNVAMGIYVAYLLKGSYTVSNPFIGDIREDIEGLKRTDMGFIFGSGVDFNLLNIEFGLQYRYSMGFVDLDLPTGPGAPTIALRNYNHALTLAIFL